ncbi:hypothetical protein PQX77_019885 [Marasmius sp. AFHP31]|nr:hypothetical protein PQX77_019885 [Marasmius sp. AFHP31]
MLGIKDVPSTSSLLQEDVLVSFLRSLESREADDAFVRSVGDGFDDGGMPERFYRPTVFCTLTQTSIAVADNVWGSGENNFIPNGKTSSLLHHWSFQEDGHSQLLPESCHDLGLPVHLRLLDLGFITTSWSTDDYKSLHQYQVLRGFDPTTTDFAQHLEYDHIFQPQNDDDRFEDVCDRVSACLERDLDLSSASIQNTHQLRENQKEA